MTARDMFAMTNLSMRGRLIVLVLFAALPALVLISYNTWDARVKAAAHARENLQRLVTQAAQQQAQIVEGARQTLVAIAQAPFALHDDFARCNQYLAGILARSSGIYHSMGIYRADGLLVCNAVPWQGRIFSPDRLYVSLAKSTGKFAIGEYQVGRVTRQHGINFGYPLADARGNVIAVAFVALDLAWINRMAAAVPLPERAILTVIDRDGVVLARHPALEESTGQKLRVPRVLEAALAGRNEVIQAIGTDGVDRLYAFEGVTENPDGTIPLRVIVSLPLSTVLDDVNALWVRNFIYLGIVTILLLAGAWYGAEILMLRNIRILLDATRDVQAGRLGARTGLVHGKDELAQLGAAFDAMAHALEKRDADLQRATHDLQQQAITDPLTGLYNRRFLYEVLPRELARARRKNAPVAVMMIDIDHFKRVNDTYGHEAGDLVLKEIACLIKAAVRASDVCCRYGGEEIAVVLPEAPIEGAQRRAEALRTAVEKLEIDYPGQKRISVTLSLGVAVYPDHGGDADSLLRAADVALYEAKSAGRNCVVVHSMERAT
jgi:diguanylate cyclase (GGDEF)-like protein